MKRYQEKRRHKRINDPVPVTFIPTSDLPIQCSCNSRDISEGGLRINTSREPLAGGEAEVIFALPGTEESLALHTEVVWAHPSRKTRGRFESGIKFVGMGEAKRKLLRDYISRNRQKTAPEPIRYLEEMNKGPVRKWFENLLTNRS